MSNNSNQPTYNYTHTRSRSQIRRARRRQIVQEIALIPFEIAGFLINLIVVTGRCAWSELLDSPIELAEQQARKKKQRSMEKEVPCPLPAVRKRALSIPLPVMEMENRFWRKNKKKQKTIWQSQSSFFERLPPEVRVMIYGFYLSGDGPVHIIRRTDKRLGNLVCADGPESHCHSYFPNPEWGYDVYWRTRAWRKNKNEMHVNTVLPLLKSCRRL